MSISPESQKFKRSYTFLDESLNFHHRTSFSAKVPNHKIVNIFLNVIVRASKLKNAEQQLPS
jgi:hypothetical protein